jgi:hypothetical protein
MKKIYTLVTAAFLCSNFSAQTTDVAGFEGFNLTPESYDNGSAGGGDFSNGMLTFTNYYDAAWSSWNGFSVSNVSDNTTSGWGNQYSAFTGSGYNSSNYAVFYPSGSVFLGGLDAYGSIDSLRITNSTYAAISMRDGDAFAKQFGSVNGADGNPDGTNGEDFFRLWVIGESLSGLTKDSVEVYLADYRFADNAQDYILDTWFKVDLTTFGFEVARIKFRMESSDNGAWGMNTPSYFAIDDIAYKYLLGVGEKLLNVSVLPNPFSDQITVKGENGTINLLDINGQVLLSVQHTGISILNTSDLPGGVYFLEVTSMNGKAIQKLIK